MFTPSLALLLDLLEKWPRVFMMRYHHLFTGAESYG
jgi:hypothetical protein